MEAKRLTRHLERAYLAACRTSNQVSTSANVIAAWYTRQRSYRELCQSKRTAFWCDTVENDRESPRRLWRSVNQLLDRGRPSASSAISVDDFSRYLSDKVNAVRSNTSRAPDPHFSGVRQGASLTSFSPYYTCVIIARRLSCYQSR